MILITGANLVRIDRIDHGTELLVDGDSIRATGAEAVALSKDAGGVERIDGAGRYLAPGFIDMHFHGAGRYLVDNGPDELAAICRLLPEYGVTSFLPTVVPQIPEPHRKLVGELASGSYEGGTRVLGFFLEGPFLKLTGALPPDALVGLTAERVQELKNAAAPYPVVFAVAPDVEGVVGLIEPMAKSEFTDSGRVPVFVTHTAATVQEMQAGIEAGITHATHFYDVFPAPPVSDPGVRPCGAVEAVLADPRVTVDFILDGEHVDPVALQMALQTKGAGGVSLITDANLGACLPPGRYEGLDGVEVEFAYEGAPARMTERTRSPGGLAGSGLSMDRAVRNAISMAGVDLVQAVRMASANPASVIGVLSKTGSIDAGKRADLVLLSDDLVVEQTWVGGRSVYKRET